MIFGPDNPHRFETFIADDGHPAIRVVGVTQDEWLAAQAEIDRLRAMPCPYVRTSDEGTSYCSLGTA